MDDDALIVDVNVETFHKYKTCAFEVSEEMLTSAFSTLEVQMHAERKVREELKGCDMVSVYWERIPDRYSYVCHGNGWQLVTKLPVAHRNEVRIPNSNPIPPKCWP